ncbi:hypothetical protein SAMN05216215_1013144 [Saccharopolyspora shandongensis]|uniref:Uncharacterized protein n=1 Tax=Saccharopolyspora shandongensis TaxID=418495 RepID=A0A1H3DKJ4_9PSEU|nr:hypothetical protein SAMN05216215_1013144 [Saccharopolyspora shandongensis]
MFWLQLGTLIAFNVVIFAMLFIPASNPQHASRQASQGTSPGACITAPSMIFSSCE